MGVTLVSRISNSESAIYHWRFSGFLPRAESHCLDTEDSLPWTLLTLTKHLMRQRSVRILLPCFALVLLWVQVPHFLGDTQDRIFLGSGPIQASWPRWLVYAWLILGALRWGQAQDRILVRPCHPLEAGTAWFAIRSACESCVLVLWAELLVVGISAGFGAWFHVEPIAVLTNLLLSLSATLTFVVLTSSFRNGSLILISLGLVLALTELLILSFPLGRDRSMFGLSLLLINLGLAHTLNTFGFDRCRSQS